MRHLIAARASAGAGPSLLLCLPCLLFLLCLLCLGAAGCGGQSVEIPAGTSWGSVPVAPWSASERLAVTNNSDDTIAFVSLDLPRPALLGAFAVGDIPVEAEGPHHLAASPDGRFLYYALSNYVPGSGTGPHGAHGLGTVPGALVKIRADDGSKAAEAVVDRSPGDVILARDGRTAFVSHFDLLRLMTQVTAGTPAEQGFSTVAVVDTGSMARPPLYPLCPTVHGVALSGDEQSLYATCSYSDELAILDVAARTVRRLDVGPQHATAPSYRYFPYAAVRSPRDESLWISCQGTGELRVYDARAGRMDPARTVLVGGVPFFGAFLSDGSTLVVPHQGDEVVSIIDTQTAKEKARIALPPSACLAAHAALISPDDSTAYIVCEGDRVQRRGTVVAIDLVSRAVTGSVEVGLYPDGIARLPPAPPR